MTDTILLQYGITNPHSIKSFGTGLINNTWLISDVKGEFILQKVNQEVFKKPLDIAGNIEKIGGYLSSHHHEYLFVKPVNTLDGNSMIRVNGEYFRMFPFVKNSHTNDVAETPGQAFEASRQFALFTKNLDAFNLQELKITLPDFHNLSLRFEHFKLACKNGDAERINEAEAEIYFLTGKKMIVSDYEKIKISKGFHQRVTHHDTKISNVLFDNNEKGLCVIDLDTVMPGYFISDVGDMMRTYLSPVSEEEKDFDKIQVRDDYFKAIVEGYLSEMGTVLTPMELDFLVYSGMFLIYMQALRFLTDHLEMDRYYGAAYPGHNFVRAKNQIILLKRLLEKETYFRQITKETISGREGKFVSFV